MNNVFFGDEWPEEELNKNVCTLDAILLNQYPFVRREMTVREYLEEKEYYVNHFTERRDGTYKTLWQQRKENK